MPRKLPWLSGTNSKASKTSDARPSLQHRKPPTSDGESSRDQADHVRDNPTRARFKARAGGFNTTPLIAATAAASLTSPAARNPSSSPPPPPPEVEFMNDGLAGDDIWVMVEDEFLATAKAFTAHLHHAEYQRLKRLARASTKRKSDGSDKDRTGRTIARPVDGRARLSVEARNWVRAEELRVEQGRTLRNVGADFQGRRSNGEEEWEDDVWRSNPRLAGLMVRREHSTKLAGLVGTQAQTQRPMVERARDDAVASLCSEDDDGDDDQNAPLTRHNGPSGRYIRPSENPNQTQSGTIPSSPPELPPSPPLAPSRGESRWSSRGKPVEDVLDDTSWRSEFEHKMAKRKAKAANAEDKRKSLRLDEIPTFLV